MICEASRAVDSVAAAVVPGGTRVETNWPRWCIESVAYFGTNAEYWPRSDIELDVSSTSPTWSLVSPSFGGGSGRSLWSLKCWPPPVVHLECRWLDDKLAAD